MAYDPSQPLKYYEVPDIIKVHDAYSKVGNDFSDRMEGDKRRRAARNLSFKVGEASSPFPKDRENIDRHLNESWTSVREGVDPTESNLKATSIQAAGKADKEFLDQQEQIINNYNQRFPGAVDASKFTSSKSRFLNEDHNERANTREEIAGITSDPANLVDYKKHVANLFSDEKLFPKSTIKLDETNENGDVTTKSGLDVQGKMFRSEPVMVTNPDGSKTQKEQNGVPLFKQVPIKSAQEALPYANKILEGDKEFADIAKRSVYRENKKDIESAAKRWSDQMKDTNGYEPTEEEKTMYKRGLTEKMATESVAKQLFGMHEAFYSPSNSRTLDEPRESDKKESKRRLGRVGADTDQEVEVTTGMPNNERRDFVDVKGGDGKLIKKQEAYSKSPVQFQLFDNTGNKKELAGKSVIIPPSTVMYSATKGKVDNDVAHTGRYINTSFEIMKEKDGVKTIDRTNRKDYARKIQELKAEGYKVSYEPVNNFIVLSNKNPYTNKDSQEYREYEELKRLQKEPPAERDNSRIGELEAKFANKMDNVATPAQATINQISRFNTDPESIVMSHGSDEVKNVHRQIKQALNSPVPEDVAKLVKDRSEIATLSRRYNAEARKGKQSAERFLKDNNLEVYKENGATKIRKSGGAKEVERRTSDGKIAIFDGDTKQFIRYK
jgi:hypothetical protein